MRSADRKARKRCAALFSPIDGLGAARAVPNPVVLRPSGVETKNHNSTMQEGNSEKSNGSHEDGAKLSGQQAWIGSAHVPPFSPQIGSSVRSRLAGVTRDGWLLFV
jgi:hypothetical protein